MTYHGNYGQRNYDYQRNYRNYGHNGNQSQGPQGPGPPPTQYHAQYHLPPLPPAFPPSTFAQPMYSHVLGGLPHVLPFEAAPTPIGIGELNSHYPLHSHHFPTPPPPLINFRAAPLPPPPILCPYTHPLSVAWSVGDVAPPASSVAPLASPPGPRLPPLPPLSRAMRKEWKMQGKRRKREAIARKSYLRTPQQMLKATEKKRMRNRKKRAAAEAGKKLSSTRDGLASMCNLNLPPLSGEDANTWKGSLDFAPITPEKFLMADKRLEHSLAEVDRDATKRLRPEIGGQDKELQEPVMGSPSSALSTLMENRDPQNGDSQIMSFAAQYETYYATACHADGLASTCDLNLPPSSAEDAAEGAISKGTLDFASITPEKGTASQMRNTCAYERLEHNLADVDRDATKRLGPEIGGQDKELQEPMMASPSSADVENHDPHKGDPHIMSLSKKHRPKVAKEGKLKRTLRSTASKPKPDGEKTLVKRKYVRRKGVEIPPALPKEGSEDSSIDLKGRKLPKKSCRKALNFDVGEHPRKKPTKLIFPSPKSPAVGLSVVTSAYRGAHNNQNTFHRLSGKQSEHLNVNRVQNALASTNHEHNALVLYKSDGSMVPLDSSFGPKKKPHPPPKVDLDEETSRVWKLLWEDIKSEGTDGIDEENARWWEEERRVFQGRVDSFVARMHVVQGDRRFSLWKGSVVDSAVGAFLTQNTADHLSSWAFMSVASRFPQNPIPEVCSHKGTAVIIHEPELSELSREKESTGTRDISKGPDQEFSDTHPTKHGLSPADDSNKMNITNSKGKSRGAGKEKKEDFDWNSLRRLAESNGRKRLGMSNTRDCVDWEAVRYADVNEMADAIKIRGMKNVLAERIKDFLNGCAGEHGRLI